MTTTIDVRELSQDLAKLLDLTRAGHEIVISECSNPIARISAIIPTPPSQKRRVAGLHAGASSISDDFDQPLPDEFWIGAL